MITQCNLLTDEQIAKVRAPLEEAYWVPNKAFTLPQFFDLEVNKIFVYTWMSVGFEAEAQGNGNAYPTSILGDMPIVMGRNEVGKLHTYHNVCPRDGCIAPVEDLYAYVDLSNLIPGSIKDGTELVIDRYMFKSNWKNVYEYFGVNINHECSVHWDLKAAPNVPHVDLDGFRLFEEADDRGYYGLRYSEEEADIAYVLARTPKLKCDDGSDHNMNLYPNLNTNIRLFPNFLLITILQPQAPDRTAYNSIIRYPEDAASNPRYTQARNIIIEEDWAQARNEDAAVVNRVQIGRKSPAFDQHFLIPF